MRQVTEKEVEAVARLDDPARFKYFIKFVADTEEAWGLWDDGWALYEPDNELGTDVFPVWPAKEYAELCREPEWTNFRPKPIALDHLLEQQLPEFRADGILVAVFPSAAGRAVTVVPDTLEAALRDELLQYE